MKRKTFGPVRKEALANWKEYTGRKRYGLTDNFSQAWECNWQSQHTDHISIFCSLGEFCTHITDLLTDKRFDHISFEDKDIMPVFRFYTRLLLVTSEILTDFQDIIMKFENVNQTKARKRMNLPELAFSFQNLMDFINRVVKHKTDNFHVKNHHAEIVFKDDENIKKTKGSMTIKVTNVNEVLKNDKPLKFLEMPNLGLILAQIIVGYNIVNDLFASDVQKFEEFCEGYRTKEHEN